MRCELDLDGPGDRVCLTRLNPDGTCPNDANHTPQHRADYVPDHAAADAFAAGYRAGYGRGRDDEANCEDIPEWYRLASWETCQPGQPYACGDYHHSGHCVRRTDEPTEAAP